MAKLDEKFNKKFDESVKDVGEIPKDAKVLAIHTGGLQGIEGMNLRLRQKKLEEIV